MKRSLLVACALSLAATGVAHAQQVKLGYVDLQRALFETEDGRRAKDKLKKDFDQKQKELDEQQEELKKAFEDLQKKRTLLPADTVAKKEAELNERLQKVQDIFVRHQRDLSQKEQDATRSIFERMQRIIGKIAMAEDLAMVLDRNQAGIVFAKPHLDLTNEVIRRYNAGEGAEGGKPAAPAKDPGLTPAKAAPAKK